LGLVAVSHHRGGTDEAEIPANAQQNKRHPEMGQAQSRQANGRGHGDQDQSNRGDGGLAKTLDQFARDETWPVHGQHMPLNT